jgi:hypothetical protein
MFYSGADITGGITGVATAPDILGPWTDRGAVMRVSNGIPESCFIVKTPDKNSFLMVFNHAGSKPEGIKTARSTSGLLPVDGKPCFTDLRLFQDKETNSGLTGWAHEFIPGRKRCILSAYLTGYWVNLEEAVLVKEPFGWTINPVKGIGGRG